MWRPSRQNIVGDCEQDALRPDAIRSVESRDGRKKTRAHAQAPYAEHGKDGTRPPRAP
jgi:hypothetical protein